MYSIVFSIVMFDRNNILSLQPDHVEHAVQLENFYRLMFSLEEVHGVLMWGFWDQVISAIEL